MSIDLECALCGRWYNHHDKHVCEPSAIVERFQELLDRIESLEDRVEELEHEAGR